MEKKGRANELQEFDVYQDFLNRADELPKESLEKLAIFLEGMLAVAGKKTA